MSFPKIFCFLALALFGVIGFFAWMKGEKKTQQTTIEMGTGQKPIEIQLEQQGRPISSSLSQSAEPMAKVDFTPKQISNSSCPPEFQIGVRSQPDLSPESQIDRVNEFFNLIPPKFPIVETISYRSRVTWLEGRPAWLADYASHFGTSRHFIARSLNQKPDYFTQKVGEGDRFNVLKSEIPLSFHLVLDISRCCMRFYYVVGAEKVLVKTYQVGLGRPDASSISGLLTPIGCYSLGKKVAIYQPGAMGFFNNQSTELIRIFGTRWIPFEKEVGECSAPAKGFGIHGAPWMNSPSGEWIENSSSLSKYDSDGCIRLSTKDMEELFAIIITKPTTIEIVKDFKEAKF